MLVTLLGKLMFDKDLHIQNALSPMVVTLLGMAMLDKDSHFQNTLLPMVVTLLGMAMLDKELQPLYLQPIITQYFIDNKSEIWLLFLIAHSKR